MNALLCNMRKMLYNVGANLRELGHFGVSEKRFTDDGHVIRWVERGVKLMASHELLHGLRVTAGTLGTHVVQEGGQGTR